MLDLFLEHKVLFFITAVVTFNFVLFITRIWITLKIARKQQAQFRQEIIASETRMHEVFSRMSQNRLDLVESMERVVKKLELPDDNLP